MSKLTFPILMSPGVTPIYTTPDKTFPIVYYKAEVIKAIEYIVDKQHKEVSWMGLVEKLSDTEYLIYKLYIPKQTVTSVSVDISESAIATLANTIIDDGHDPEHLRYHGHSHVHMDVCPSFTDQAHMSEYIENVDFFIREIRNKKSQSKVDVFDTLNSKLYQCVNTDIYDLLQTQQFYDNLDVQMKQNIIMHISATSRSASKKAPWKIKHSPSTSIDSVDNAELLELMSDPFFVRD